MKTNIVVNISPESHILALAIWGKMLSANKIVGFFKM